MRKIRAKVLALILFTVPVVIGGGLISQSQSSALASSAFTDDDAATVFKTKCAGCHGKTSEKFFDPARTDEELVTAILDGKKGAKPPNMPAYKDKGISEERARALVAYMRQLRTPPSE